MTVCEYTLCPYCSEGFCNKELTKINKLGQCMTIYDKHGMPRPALEATEAHSRVQIIEGDYYDCKETDDRNNEINSDINESIESDRETESTAIGENE